MNKKWMLSYFKNGDSNEAARKLVYQGQKLASKLRTLENVFK